MRRTWRRINRLEPGRVSVAVLGLPLLVALLAYGLAVYASQPTAGALAAAIALVAVAGTGLVYAWRLGTGGLSD